MVSVIDTLRRGGVSPSFKAEPARKRKVRQKRRPKRRRICKACGRPLP